MEVEGSSKKMIVTQAGWLSSTSPGSARTSATSMKSASMSSSWRGCRRFANTNKNPTPNNPLSHFPNLLIPYSFPPLTVISSSLLSFYFICSLFFYLSTKFGLFRARRMCIVMSMPETINISCNTNFAFALALCFFVVTQI